MSDETAAKAADETQGALDELAAENAALAERAEKAEAAAQAAQDVVQAAHDVVEAAQDAQREAEDRAAKAEARLAALEARTGGKPEPPKYGTGDLYHFPGPTWAFGRKWEEGEEIRLTKEQAEAVGANLVKGAPAKPEEPKAQKTGAGRYTLKPDAGVLFINGESKRAGDSVKLTKEQAAEFADLIE